ncbi:MAG: hypothetical protein ACTHU0_25515 [Kofleriaceae bacterium]
MSRWSRSLAVIAPVLLGACGRLGFDAQPSGDGGPGDARDAVDGRPETTAYAGACNEPLLLDTWTDNLSASDGRATATYDGLVFGALDAPPLRAWQFGDGAIAQQVSIDTGPVQAVGASRDGDLVAISRRGTGGSVQLTAMGPLLDQPRWTFDVSGPGTLDVRAITGAPDGDGVLFARLSTASAGLQIVSKSATGAPRGETFSLAMGVPVLGQDRAGGSALVSFVMAAVCHTVRVDSTGELAPGGLGRAACARAMVASGPRGYAQAWSSGGTVVIQALSAGLEPRGGVSSLGTASAFDLTEAFDGFWAARFEGGAFYTFSFDESTGAMSGPSRQDSKLGDFAQLLTVGRYAYLVYTTEQTLGTHALWLMRLCR